MVAGLEPVKFGFLDGLVGGAAGLHRLYSPQHIRIASLMVSRLTAARVWPDGGIPAFDLANEA